LFLLTGVPSTIAEEFNSIVSANEVYDRSLFQFDYLNMGCVSHTVPVIEYTWAERLQFEQAAHPRWGNHVPYLSEGEATWAVLRRGCDAAVGQTYRDSECCMCPRCRLVFWNQSIPQYFYVYTPELNVPSPVQEPMPKRALEDDEYESGTEASASKVQIRKVEG
jgi:hypothetical protein